MHCVLWNARKKLLALEKMLNAHRHASSMNVEEIGMLFYITQNCITLLCGIAIVK